MTDHLEAAVDNVAEYYGCDMDEARTAINRAIPHLAKHFAQDPTVRRAIIQELANEAEEVYEEACDDAWGAYSWLTEKLKEAEKND
ncbi:hypothetical protein [Arthrobacter woluwensis]|uniref:Uncharacterized protein n=1 Tax=Arthrobacter woluwensis TaxID=156980 RepID=A0A1H4I4I3_9MICC|nr:hypothetical protein [Arthrobacter woluwensis]SEB28994.1 hypothetical protein SAMN04489745_0034 [Arthrobacter woluwensis]SEC53325.1 hypothetical protein SAMN04489745_3111 [Arthrobacter woluwensis]